MSGTAIVNSLAVIGAGTCLYGLIRLLSAFLRWIQPPAETAEAPPAVRPPATAGGPTSAEDILKEDIVVIAAAVQAMMSGQRIVHISDLRNGASWSAEGRRMHQTSHNPH